MNNCFTNGMLPKMNEYLRSCIGCEVEHCSHNAVDCSEPLYLTASNAHRLSLVEVE